ncbi:MAG: 3,4-dihydroxy-2-butanone-4-phosphate synthase [Deltaproteobacteria bacterium]|nr:3,4-dihydroxy-2-butanone-4-phosphate synthase [Deltaproteobacteria bacterium]
MSDAETVISRMRSALDEIRAGRVVILVDDEDRENEGDLCMAAERITPDAINFMATHGRGLICLTLTEEKVRALDLPMMVRENTSTLGTAFTVSIEARRGVTTGISAADRAVTILAAVADDARPEDLVRPGHVFPLKARNGGVLVRTGQTEGSVDLARLAGLRPAGVICEIMREDGQMARREDLEKFAKDHGLMILSIADIIQYRLERESLVERISEAELPTALAGTFKAQVFSNLVDSRVHLALTKGTIERDRPILVRAHTACITGDVFGSRRCACEAQLRAAMRKIEADGNGVILYLGMEPSRAALLREFDTHSAHRDFVPSEGGRLAALREFGIGAQILKALGVGKMRLMTNSHARVVGIDGYGLEIVERVPFESATLAPVPIEAAKAERKKP